VPGRSLSWWPEKLSRRKEGTAHFLPSGQEFSELYECRGTQLLESGVIVMLFRICLGGKAQCRGRDYLGGRRLSRLQKFYCGQSGSPGTALIPELSW